MKAIAWIAAVILLASTVSFCTGIWILLGKGIGLIMIGVIGVIYVWALNGVVNDMKKNNNHNDANGGEL